MFLCETAYGAVSNKTHLKKKVLYLNEILLAK